MAVSQLERQNATLVVCYEYEVLNRYSSAMQLRVKVVDCQIHGYCLLQYYQRAVLLPPSTSEEGQAGRGRSGYSCARTRRLWVGCIGEAPPTMHWKHTATWRK